MRPSSSTAVRAVSRHTRYVPRCRTELSTIFETHFGVCSVRQQERRVKKYVMVRLDRIQDSGERSRTNGTICKAWRDFAAAAIRLHPSRGSPTVRINDNSSRDSSVTTVFPQVHPVDSLFRVTRQPPVQDWILKQVPMVMKIYCVAAKDMAYP